jgi:hypothetical protein
MLKLIAAATLLFAVGGCAVDNYGVGFRHHPLDCAVGFPHEDCLPGTAGYENGQGKQVARARAGEEQAKQVVQACNNMGYPMGTDGFLKCLDFFVRNDQRQAALEAPQRPSTVVVQQPAAAPPNGALEMYKALQARRPVNCGGTGNGMSFSWSCY